VPRRFVVAVPFLAVTRVRRLNKSTNSINPPHIAISTTAGTGSETSWAYVITDTSDKQKPHKHVAFDDLCIANLAICDPVLYYDCPEHFTAWCGFDVLAHGSEPYVPRARGRRSWATRTTSSASQST